MTHGFLDPSEFPRKKGEGGSAYDWETDFYPVRVLGAVVLSLRGWRTAAQYWIKFLHLWVQNLYPVLGLGSGGTLLEHLPHSSSVLDIPKNTLRLLLGEITFTFGELRFKGLL